MKRIFGIVAAFAALAIALTLTFSGFNLSALFTVDSVKVLKFFLVIGGLVLIGGIAKNGLRG
jgi:cytochrome c-type biogenesis protein CcmE